MENNGERRTTALEVYREVFVGRSDALAELWDLCLKRRGALVVGDRRVGKTAVLMRLYMGLVEGGDQVVWPSVSTFVPGLEGYQLFAKPAL